VLLSLAKLSFALLNLLPACVPPSLESFCNFSVFGFADPLCALGLLWGLGSLREEVISFLVSSIHSTNCFVSAFFFALRKTALADPQDEIERPTSPSEKLAGAMKR